MTKCQEEQEERADGRVLSAYRELTDLDAAHHVQLVQQRYNRRIYVKKELSVYNRSIYDYLKSHPVANMPQVLEVVEQEGTLTVIEEYISGDTLQQRLDTDGPMEETEVLELTLQLCRILQELHGASPPIIHRDLKPENLILSPDGVLKLLDVNVARWYQLEQGQDTQIMGTVGYAAPEQFGFQQSGVTADIYAVGVMMNVLLTTELPNGKQSEGALQAVIQCCTELDPKARYQNVEKLERALRAVQRRLKWKQRLSGEPEVPQGSGFVSGATREGLRFRVRHRRNQWKKFLPPGFRSGTLPEKVLAAMGYGMVFAIAKLAGTNGATLRSQIVDQAGVILIGLFIILFSGNYQNVHAQLPLTRSKNSFLRVLGIFLYDALAIFAVAFICAALTE